MQGPSQGRARVSARETESEAEVIGAQHQEKEVSSLHVPLSTTIATPPCPRMHTRKRGQYHKKRQRCVVSVPDQSLVKKFCRFKIRSDAVFVLRACETSTQCARLSRSASGRFRVSHSQSIHKAFKSSDNCPSPLARSAKRVHIFAIHTHTHTHTH